MRPYENLKFRSVDSKLVNLERTQREIGKYSFTVKGMFSKNCFDYSIDTDLDSELEIDPTKVDND